MGSPAQSAYVYDVSAGFDEALLEEGYERRSSRRVQPAPAAPFVAAPPRSAEHALTYPRAGAHENSVSPAPAGDRVALPRNLDTRAGRLDTTGFKSRRDGVRSGLLPRTPAPDWYAIAAAMPRKASTNAYARREILMRGMLRKSMDHMIR
ncbi:hypothetical protein C2E23DRAFT_890567 [Lenzites betulinus]|nr:hypothetical protein C2E23DRAFT_890567 [Lenzites betulinus]